MRPEILLTGGTGFIGYYLAHALAAQATPFAALVRPGADTRHLEELGECCELRVGDLTDPLSLYDALTDIRAVIHAAALVSYEDRREDEMTAVNGTGTANLVNMMIQAGTERLVHLSSVAVLNRIDGGAPVSVADRWPLKRLPTAYARSKFAAEREIWRGQAEGLSVAALYPSTVIGAGNWHGSGTPSLWRRVDDGLRFTPRGSAGFVDVRDVARAALNVLERGIDRDRVLLNAGHLPWRDFFRAVAESIGADAPRIALARWQSALLWPLVGGLTRAGHRISQATFTYREGGGDGEGNMDYIPVATTIGETGKAYRMSKSSGEELPPTFLPLVGVAR